MKKRVCYFYDQEIGDFSYGTEHPMSPHRIRMTHSLLVNYGLYKKMAIYRPHKATTAEIAKFHSDEYLDFLRNIQPDNIENYVEQQQKFNLRTDCPVFEGMYRFLRLSAGGSIDGAIKLNTKQADIAINWSGGFHHAKKSMASGFCYVNDIVLAVLELLKYHKRVLYVDIDIHHGDGVEEAFYYTNRVMTVSFHNFGNFFPGTGALRDIGSGKGKRYSVNVPLKRGIKDHSYENIFTHVMTKVMEAYQPGVVVLQCGADSLNGDALGCFNLTLKGHGKCVEFFKKYDTPLLLLGGGGYTPSNVARCWAYETSIALGCEIPNQLPFNEYLEGFGPNTNLHIKPSNIQDQNTREYLDQVKTSIFENLRTLPCAPGVPMQTIPPNFFEQESDDEQDRNSQNPGRELSYFEDKEKS
ncbi:hypothetical protein QYM36_018219 [Artemia franciscana]|uniref:Histone deacetylase n=1 Tax=Artemia franciscana TaxID=6661 RepID=A0AA88KUU8_ARTSF|nr:hypothetical protein QYM36_018219 [Artemia franciscana]